MIDESVQSQFFLWDYLQKADKPIVLFGTGDGADKTLKVMGHYGLKPVCFTMTGDFRPKPNFKGYSVLPFEEVQKQYNGFIILLCFGTDKPEVIQQILDLGKSEGVDGIFVPDMPVAIDDFSDSGAEECVPCVYTPEYIDKHQEELATVRKLLARTGDKKSLEVFDCWLEYRLSGKVEILENISSPREEILALLKLSKKKDDFFIDAGAYKGDTVEEFLKLSGRESSDVTKPTFKKIIAIEPDLTNYTMLRRKFYAYGTGLFRAYHAAAWSSDEMLEFVAKSGKAGYVNQSNMNNTDDAEVLENTSPSQTIEPIDGKSGIVTSKRQVRTVQIEGVKIDTLYENCAKEFPDEATNLKPTYIKIDVEGGEAEVIKGAKEVITKYRPKMLVSLYHRPEDMFKLPLLIHSYAASYKFYLRRTRCLPGWEFQLVVTK
ncbi:MAG: FkbM family methyltransferase [Oscillospiraceae bacterium]|nr:FkbM family methyltransferase [Oscillospiraceae bacterium]